MILLLCFTACGKESSASTEPAASAAPATSDEVIARVKRMQAFDEFRYMGSTDMLFDGDEYTYDDEGQLSKYINYSMAKVKETDYAYEYEYYDNGDLKLSLRYESMNGSYELQQELKFDEKGLIYEQVSYSGGVGGRAPDYNFYTYDEAGNLIKDEHYYDLNEIHYTHTYTYDDSGKLVESTYSFTDYKGNARHYVYHYNEHGDPATEVVYNGDMKAEALYFYIYEYDAGFYPKKVTVYRETHPDDIQKIMGSAQFPLFDIKQNDVGIHYKTDDALHVKVFKFTNYGFNPQQHKILLAKMKANIDIDMWGYDYVSTFK